MYDNGAYEHDLKQFNNNNKSSSNEKKAREARESARLSEEEVRAETRIIYKNLLLISFAFLLLFVAFESMAKLQSSINVVSVLNIYCIFKRQN